MTSDEATRIGEELRELRKVINLWSERMGGFEVLLHAPGECDIKKTVAELKSWKDKVNGQGAILVFFVVSAASVVGGFIVKFLK